MQKYDEIIDLKFNLRLEWNNKLIYYYLYDSHLLF